MIPTIGRIVHYMNLGDKDGLYPPEIQAALIVKADPIVNKSDVSEEKDFNVTLLIFYPTGQFWREKVPFAKEPTRGSWFWPAKI